MGAKKFDALAGELHVEALIPGGTRSARVQLRGREAAGEVGIDYRDIFRAEAGQVVSRA